MQGMRCEDKVEACLSFPCQNKAVCQNDFENMSYMCFCRPGYDGRDCENNIGKLPSRHSSDTQVINAPRIIIVFFFQMIVTRILA